MCCVIGGTTYNMLSRLCLFVVIVFVTGGYCDQQFQHCGEVLEVSESGNITSPNFPERYPPNLQCEWVITVPEGKGIVVELVYFYTDSKGHGGGDVLQCFESQPGTSHGGKSSTWHFVGFENAGKTFLSRSNKLWLLFQTSNEIIGGQGFFLRYRAFNLNECPDPGPLVNGQRTYPGSYSAGQRVRFSCDPGYTLNGNSLIKCLGNLDTHPFWSGSKPFCNVICLANRVQPGNGLVYHVPNDVFTVLSPNFPSYYDGNELCTWEINTGSGYHVNISMYFFDLRPGQGTYLEIWDGSWSQVLSRSVRMLGNFSGNSFPSSIMSRGNTVALLFKSGTQEHKYSKGGFKMVYNTVHANYDPVGCIKPPLPGNMYYLPVKPSYNSGDRVQYHCIDGFYFPDRESSSNNSNTCIGDPAKQWSIPQNKNLPKCVATCHYYNETSGSLRRVILTNSTGVIYSSGYPEMLKTGLCGYVISLNPGQTVSINFQVLDLVPGLRISLYESTSMRELGSLLEPIDNLHRLETVQSNTNIVNVIVNKTSSEDGGKFILRYQSVLQDQCEVPPVVQFGHRVGQNRRYTVGSSVTYECNPFFQLRGTPTIQCVGNSKRHINEWNSLPPSCTGACGGQYTTSNGTIVSPAYPGGFPANVECVWNITAPTQGFPFLITVSRLELSASDHLLIHYHQNDRITSTDVSTSCSNSNCSITIIAQQSFEVELKSGEHSIGAASRFELKFQLSASCPVPDTPINGFVVGNDYHLSAQIMYRCTEPYDLIGAHKATCKAGPDGSLSWSHPPPRCHVLDCRDLDGAPITREAGYGAITNLGYPSDTIKGSQDCHWQIRASSGSMISMHFRYLELPDIADDSFIEIFEGFDITDDKTLIKRFQGGDMPVNVTSRSEHVTVHYKSLNRDMVGYRGFYLQYSAMQPHTTQSSTVTTENTKVTIPSKKTTVITTATTIKQPTTASTPASTTASTTATPSTLPASTNLPTTKTTLPTTATTLTSTAETTKLPSTLQTTLQSTSKKPSTVPGRPSPETSESMKSTSIKTTPFSTTFLYPGRTTVTTPKIPIVLPTFHPSPSVIPSNSTNGVSASSQNNGPSSGVISAAVIIPLLAIIAACGVGFVFWYRKKYPVRMTFRRRFGKFSNPAYDNQKSPVGHNLSLVRDPNSPLPNYGQDRPPPTTLTETSEGNSGLTNDAFTFDFDKDIDVSENGNIGKEINSQENFENGNPFSENYENGNPFSVA